MVLVAEHDGLVVGLAVLLPRAERRSQRIGEALLAAVTAWLRGQGAGHVEVAVHAFNRDARRFYERFGFDPSIDRLVLAT